MRLVMTGAEGVRQPEIEERPEMGASLGPKQGVVHPHTGIVDVLRSRNHIEVAESLGKESLRAQLRSADKMMSPIALIFGQKEAFEDSIILRDLKNGVQETVPLSKMIETLKKRS